MLSIDECKKILNQGKTKYSEKEIQQIREFLYQVALIEFENYKKLKIDEQRNNLHKGIDG